MGDLKDSLIDSVVYKNTKKICSDMEEDLLCSLTSVMGAIFAIAWSDRAIRNEEVTYIKREVTEWISLTEDKLNELVDLNIHVVQKIDDYESHIDSFVEYLGETLKEKHRDEFLQSLFVIARSDLEITESEVITLKRYAKLLKVSEAKVSVLKASADMIIDEKMGKDFSEYKVLIGSDKYEF